MLIHGTSWVGFMGDVNMAARDPIFWPHHCNIDRLWTVWLAMGQGRADPNDAPWLEWEFTFFDVGTDGKPTVATIQVQDLLSIEKLGYAYQKPAAPPALAARPPSAVPVHGETIRPLAATAVRNRAAAPHKKGMGAIQLSNTRNETVALPLVEGTTSRAIRALAPQKKSGERGGELLLSIEGIELMGAPGVHYEVYLNLPKNDKPSVENAHYIGTLSFFGMNHREGGHGEGHAPHYVKLALPAKLRELIAQNKLDTEKLDVTFVPRTGTEPVNKDAPPKAPPARTVVTIKRIRLLHVR